MRAERLLNNMYFEKWTEPTSNKTAREIRFMSQPHHNQPRHQPKQQQHQQQQHTLLSSREHQITLQRPFQYQNVNISTATPTKTTKLKLPHQRQQHAPQDLLRRVQNYRQPLTHNQQLQQQHLDHRHTASLQRKRLTHDYDNNNHSINFNLNIFNRNEYLDDDVVDEQLNYFSSRNVFTKATPPSSPPSSSPPPLRSLPPPPYYKHINGTGSGGKISRHDDNVHNAYIEPTLRTPIKMQQQEYHIEHSQLMLQRNGNRTETNVPHQSDRYTQIIAALAVSLGPLAAGLGKGYSSPAIASLQDLQIRHRGNGNYTSFPVNDQEASWVASLSLLGALFGGIFGGFFLQYGRRRVLTVMSLPFSLSWIITVFAKSVTTMFATAFLGGFCCSIVSMVTQVYISEIASPDVRGFLSAIQKIAGHLGVLVSFSLGAYLDWRQLAMLVSIAPMLLFLTVIYIPETPSFLVLNGQEDEAYRSLQWLRGPNKNVELELETIRSNIQSTITRTNIFPTITLGNLMTMASVNIIYTKIKSMLKNARVVKPLSITCGLMIFQRFTGANSFGFYAVNVFRQTFAGLNPHCGAIAVGFVQLLAAMLSGLLIDTVGRIPLLIFSSVFMSLALACFGSYIYYEQANKLITNSFSLDATASTNTDWIPLLCVLVFTIAFSIGISPISSLLVGELFPLEYRGLGSSIATSFSYFCAFLSVKTFVDFQELLGLHGAFWLYACISCCGLFFVVTCVPETKGKDLDEMDPKYAQTLTIHR